MAAFIPKMTAFLPQARSTQHPHKECADLHKDMLYQLPAVALVVLSSCHCFHCPVASPLYRPMAVM